MADTEKALAMLRNPLYAMFLDFEATFNFAFRNKFTLPLVKMGVFMNISDLLVAIQGKHNNYRQRDTGKLLVYTQATGVAKGNISPLLLPTLPKGFLLKQQG